MDKSNNRCIKNPEKKVFDVIVLGGGPAGITSAIYLARRNLCVLVLYEKLGGQATLTTDIENYVGFKFITGEDFTKRLDEHLDEYDVNEINTKVEKIVKKDNQFIVSTKDKKYKAKSIIVASGSRQRHLGVPGEKEFLNRGVAYCATCDAPLFRGKDVAIIGGGNSALESAIQLESYAKKVYILTINDKLLGENIMIDKVKKLKNVKIIPKAISKEILGDKFVTSLKYEKDKKLNELKVGGIFVEIGYIPNSEIVKVKKNDYGEIIIDTKNRTSVKGIFAAGDVTNISVKQIIVAAGEGAKAAISAADYLARLKD